MPIISTLKSSRTWEKRALIKEENEAQKLLQENYSSVRKSNMSSYGSGEGFVEPRSKIVKTRSGER